ncbi:MAG: SDR family oxidoreductase [Clostridia bacterium]|nr:SDR family oxidoreductase [Clostridia bacterium]
MNRVLVTGGAGFLGSYLCAELVKAPDNYVIALDNLSTGKMDNLAGLERSGRFEFIEWNVQQPIDLSVNQIYHAAAPASPKAYQHSPTSCVKTCVLGTLNMLELAKKYSAKILLFSTSEVYGKPLVHPQHEGYFGNVNPVGPRSCYDEGKRCAETLCFDYAREFGTRAKIARIFNTYGPRLDSADGRVVSSFTVQALRGDPITIQGDGSQTRSFCYVDDMVRGLLLLMDGTEDSFIGPVNLGNPEEITVLTLAQKILKLAGSSSALSFLPLPGDDPAQRRPDISLAKEKLNWEPVVSLDEGLEQTIRYYRGLLNP